MSKEKYKTNFKRSLGLAGISGIITFFVIYCIYYMYSFAPFGVGTLAWEDGMIQYLDFFSYFRDILLGKNNISYTFSDTLGGDTLSIFHYYLASPFNLLIVFFSNEQILVFFNLIVALKLSLSAFTMAYFLYSCFNQNLKSVFIILFSLSYALMHYNIVQSSNIMWLDGIYMLPLMILGVKKAVRDRSISFLSVSTAVCILFNWYIAGICCVFSIMWFFFDSVICYIRNATGNKKEKIENFILGLINYGGSMVIAVLISACLFLPTIYSMLGGKGLKAEVDFSFLGNILSCIEQYHIGAISTEGNPSLYCGSLVLLGIIGFFGLKNISRAEKWVVGTFVSLCILIFYWKPLILVFSLFGSAMGHWYRYTFVTIFLFIYIAATFFEKSDEKIKDKYIKYSFIFSGILLLFNYIKPTLDISYIYSTIFFLIIISIVLVFIERNNSKTKQRYISIVLMCLVIFELGFNAKTLWINKYSVFDEKIESYPVSQEKQIDEIKQIDTTLYRISQTNYKTGAGYNESLAYNYASNTGYTSCPENIQLNFLDKLGYRMEGGCITIARTSVLAADSLIGIKYVLSDSAINGLIEQNNLGEYNNKKVYKNPYCLPMAFIIESFNEEKIKDTLNPFEYHNNLYSQLLNDEISLYKKIEYQKENIDGNIRYSLQLPQGNYAIYGNIPFSPYIISTLIFDNGEMMDYAGWLSQSVFYIPTEKNAEKTEVTLKSDYYDGFGEEQFYALDLDMLEKVTQKLSSQSVDDIVLGYDEINYEIEVESDKYLYLSIPYSDGWEININDKKVEPLLLAECMMVIPLTAGNNVIDMDYTIPGLKLGIIITIIGIILLIVWNITVKNKKLMNWLYKFITSTAMRYIIVGGCTTMVNLVVFTVLCKIVNMDVNVSNVISIICAIFFAYVTNKIFVFESKCNSKKELLIEMGKFVGARISTMIIEVGGVFLLYNVIRQDELIAKLETQIIVLVVNYFISKFIVFRTKEEAK